MTSEVSKMRDAEAIAEPLYICGEHETDIDAPVEAVWPAAINFGAWQDYAAHRTVRGQAGRPGHLLLLKKQARDFVAKPYFAQVIHADAPTKIVWKVYSEHPDAEEDFIGFVEYRLTGMGRRTRFRVSGVYEFKAQSPRLVAGDGASVESMFQKLKSLVNATGPA